MEVNFTLKVKDVQKAFQFLRSVGKRPANSAIIKLRILDEHIDIVVKDSWRKIPAKTSGTADVCVPYILFTSYFSNNSNPSITFKFTTGQMECGTSIFSSNAISVEPLSEKEDDEFPIDAARLSVLRLSVTKTPQEIEALGLTSTVNKAKKLQREKILEAVEILKNYEVSFDEIKSLIDNKISKE